MAPLSKAEVRQNWHAYISARVGPPPQPMTDPWRSWVLLQQSLARFGATFHPALHATYRIGPEALTRCVAALDSAHQAVARQIHHTGTFFGSGS
jgi:hypothetical protein